MASTEVATKVEAAANVSRSKNVPWFQAKIGSSLTLAGRQLLEEYSHIDPSEVETHLYKIVSLHFLCHDFQIVSQSQPILSISVT